MIRVVAVLEGRKGVRSVTGDTSSKRIRVVVDEDVMSPEDLLRAVDKADLRLEAHHWLARWLSRFGLRDRRKNTAKIISVKDMPE
jgi:hypothetical protein